MDGGAWWATVHGVTKSRPWGRKESDTTERLHFHFLSMNYILHYVHMVTSKQLLK